MTRTRLLCEKEKGLKKQRESKRSGAPEEDIACWRGRSALVCSVCTVRKTRGLFPHTHACKAGCQAYGSMCGRDF